MCAPHAHLLLISLQDGRKCLIASGSLPQVLHTRQSSYHVQAVSSHPRASHWTRLLRPWSGWTRSGRRSSGTHLSSKDRRGRVPESLVSQVLLANLSDDRFGAPIVVPCSRHNRSSGEPETVRRHAVWSLQRCPRWPSTSYTRPSAR